MLKKLLFIFTLIFSVQFVIAQAPGPDCSSPTTLTLVPGGTLSTGLQSTLGLGFD